MPASMNAVPPEILRIILSHIPPEDYLKVTLVSKTFAGWASSVFKWNEMTKKEVVQGHTSLEASLPRTRRLKEFVCIHCGLVKPAKNFTDNQAVKTNYTRVCISCGISRNTYTKGQLPKINGVEHIPCWRCRRAVPKYDRWEEILASGKARLSQVLQGSKSAGLLQRYQTKDGRSLDWVPELQSLAFCKPCLDLMMRQEPKSQSMVR